jgi:hypothetical protein
VQPAQPRGAVAAPEPPKEPSLEPSAVPTPARAHEASAVGGRGGGRIGEFFAGLQDAWMLICQQRARLAPAVETALSSGWTPAALAAFTGANTEGVPNPFAVLTARLSPAELPAPTGQRPARPPWCGECDYLRIGHDQGWAPPCDLIGDSGCPGAVLAAREAPRRSFCSVRATATRRRGRI